MILSSKKIILFDYKTFTLIILIFILLNIIFPSFLRKIKFFINKYKPVEENNNWIKNNTSEILDNYLSIFKGNYDSELAIDIERIKKYFSLKVLSKKKKSAINFIAKENLRSLFNKRFNKNFVFVKNIFIEDAYFFGNRMIALNNIIYYSEVLGIKNIYLNSAYDWFIKNDVITDSIHISVKNKSEINCYSKETFCGGNYGFYFPIYLKPERRSMILKNEIKRNLPKIKINKDDLFIYIRSGDSFGPLGNEYTPAPFCFYHRILSHFKFKDIYIISIDNLNPIIGKLLSKYPNIIHKLNSIKKDLALICNAYNLVNSVSSFSQVAISFNDNLINLFEYEVYKMGEKILHFHYDFDKLDRNFNVYRMKPSKNYYIKMFNWRNTDSQRKLLFEENCKYDFIKTNSNKTFFD